MIPVHNEDRGLPPFPEHVPEISHKLVHLVDLIRVIIDLVQIILVLYHTAGGSHMMLVFDIRLGRITSMRLHSNRENEIFFRCGA